MIVNCPTCNKQYNVPKHVSNKKIKVNCHLCETFFYHTSNFDFRLNITADQLRVKEEKKALSITLLGVALLLFGFIGITLGLAIILIFVFIIVIKIKQNQQLGNCVLISESQFSKIYTMCKSTAKKLDMPMPKVYIKQEFVLNAYAISTFKDKGMVVLNSSLIEALTPNELLSIIGHEFTHIKCNHTRWGIITNLHGQYYFPIISDVMMFITSYYSRKCETTSDRGGLVVTQNLDASIKALVKLAIGKELFDKIDINIFIDQAKRLDNNFMAKAAELGLTHPMILNRIRYLIEFHKSEEYKSFINH